MCFSCVFLVFSTAGRDYEYQEKQMEAAPTILQCSIAETEVKDKGPEH